MAQKPFRGAVVGCRMGRGHAQVMADCDDFELVAVCDLDEEQAKKTAEQFEGAKAYTDFEKMLEAERPDVVAIATPNDSHARLTLQAVESGVRGICCEKPMAVNMGQARAMVAACRENGVSLIVNHQRRMSAPMVRMRELIEEGAIGDVYLLRASNAGDILSDGTHAVDSLRWLAGDEDVRWVFGQVYREEPDPTEAKAGGYHTSGGWRYGHPVETGGFGVFEFASGLRAEVLTGRVQFPGRRYQDYEVFGTKGRLWRAGDNADPPILIQDEQGGGWRAVDIDESLNRRQAMVDSYMAFARMMREGGPHPLSGDSALKDHEVVMAIYESARTHSRIELPLRQEAFPLALMLGEEGG